MILTSLKQHFFHKSSDQSTEIISQLNIFNNFENQFDESSSKNQNKSDKKSRETVNNAPLKVKTQQKKIPKPKKRISDLNLFEILNFKERKTANSLISIYKSRKLEHKIKKIGKSWNSPTREFRSIFKFFVLGVDEESVIEVTDLSYKSLQEIDADSIFDDQIDKMSVLFSLKDLDNDLQVGESLVLAVSRDLTRN